MLIESSKRLMFSYLLMSIAVITYATTSNVLLSAPMYLIGFALFMSCDFLYSKKKKNYFRVQIKGKKHTFKNVKNVYSEYNAIHVETEDSLVQTFELKKFKEEEISNFLIRSGY